MSGVDFYGNDGQKIDRWVAVVRLDKKDIETTIAKDLAPGPRHYKLYLPLFIGVDSLEVGVHKGESFKALSPR